MTASSRLAPFIGPLVASALLLVAPHGTRAAHRLPDNSAEAHFKALDTNRDGVVSRDEYESNAAFAAMDTDRNNRISTAELDAAVGSQHEGMPSAAQRMSGSDNNGNQEISHEEFRSTLEKRFHWLDSNDDGHLDLPEMKAGFGVPFIHQ
jgi:Ca2+-binding EF-hand superfamily protein